jgi:hypothetical protein
MRTWRNRGSIILSLLFRLRIVIVILLVLLVAAGGVLAFRPLPLISLALGAASLVVAAATSFVHLRHIGLAILVALAPLAGLVAAGAVGDELTTSGVLSILGLGYVVSALAGGEIVRRVLDKADPIEAARQTLVRLAPPALLVTFAGMVRWAVWLYRTPGPSAVLAAIVVLALLLPVFGASLLPFGEAFVTAANRARERREQLLAVTTAVIEPRWAVSVTGIAIVFAVLSWFGAAPLLTHSSLRLQTAATSPFLMFLVALAIGRDWRGAAAVMLTLATLVLLDLWLLSMADLRLSLTAMVETALMGLAALLPMLLQLDGVRRFRKAGDAPGLARLRAIEELGVGPYFAAGGAAVAMLPWIVLHGSVASLTAMFVLSGLAGTFFAPAIATALEQLLPRRRSLGQLYGRR